MNRSKVIVYHSLIANGVFLSLFYQPISYAFDWLCEEEASQRSGNIISACGIGEGKSENDARLKALGNTDKEFEKLCNLSDDCKGHQVSVEPKRTDCKQTASGFKCYRLVRYEIQSGVRQSEGKELEDAQDTISTLTKESEEQRSHISDLQKALQELTERHTSIAMRGTANSHWWIYDSDRGCVPSNAGQYDLSPNNILRLLPGCKTIGNENGILVMFCDGTGENHNSLFFFGDSLQSCKKIPSFSAYVSRYLHRDRDGLCLVHLDTYPKGAVVTLDNSQLGQTPASTKLLCGKAATITFSKDGWGSVTMNIVPTEGKRVYHTLKKHGAPLIPELDPGFIEVPIKNEPHR